MVTIRKAAERGSTNIGWLNSKHTFSFGEYFDPAHNNYRALRVINDDWVAPATGFGTHPHRDMEILTYVLSGTLEHQDSMGHQSVIQPGSWQKMSAGTGIRHSEYNASETEPLHFLQIWIMPAAKGIKPNYQELTLPGDSGKWQLAASTDGREGSLVVHQDVSLSVAKLQPGDKLDYTFAPGRGGWLHVATGAATVNGQPLKAGDAAAIEGEKLEVTGTEAGEVLLFDLA